MSKNIKRSEKDTLDLGGALLDGNESASPTASPRSHPLILTDQQFAGLTTEVVTFLSEFLSRLPNAPVFRPNNRHDVLVGSVYNNPPEDGLPLPELLGVIRSATETCINTTGGGFMAYIPGGGLVTAAIADLIAGVINPFTGFGTAAPALLALEIEILQWLARLIGLPSTAFGILTSGASLATVSAIVCGGKRGQVR